ncbi:hypothetical protein PHLCEN_2v2492 [Hermanssonia centrifuga]|uniref:Uncharacterized protein n=1 Tax=Hermanssonia centrifuga TaxID=98765 RepID=A0A2R6RLR0_9APHY|nr:hypothetical protein PHLCEN_2v2492 [Hermanssonia centrifuga]
MRLWRWAGRRFEPRLCNDFKSDVPTPLLLATPGENSSGSTGITDSEKPKRLFAFVKRTETKTSSKRGRGFDIDGIELVYCKKDVCHPDLTSI